MNAKSRRHVHKEQLRGEILAAAREIFVREGYEHFSMRKLAKRIEYSPASLYLHFRNKQELFDCLVEESFTRLLETLIRLRDGHQSADPVEELKHGLWAYVNFGLRHPNHYRFAFMLRPPVTKRPYQVHGAFEVLRYMVGRCIAAKRFRVVDGETTSQALWASAHGVTSLLIQRPTFPWVARKNLITQVIDAAVDGLLAAPENNVEAGEPHAKLSRA
ncbi:MAG TPA: TetR/AcrR family transcriptional regulator [Terriglobales bacterium]|nr:TetR/AcrR family transcriptional regulator [Terriglobales bacterium]